MTLQKRKETKGKKGRESRTDSYDPPVPLFRIGTHSSSMKEEGTKCIQTFSYRTPEQNSKAATKSDSI